MTSMIARDGIGRVVSECWSNASEFKGDLRAFLDALTEPLDELCEAHGLELPGDFAAIFGNQVEQVS
jgi:hypothetical protein